LELDIKKYKVQQPKIGIYNENLWGISEINTRFSYTCKKEIFLQKKLVELATRKKKIDPEPQNWTIEKTYYIDFPHIDNFNDNMKKLSLNTFFITFLHSVNIGAAWDTYEKNPDTIKEAGHYSFFDRRGFLHPLRKKVVAQQLGRDTFDERGKVFASRVNLKNVYQRVLCDYYGYLPKRKYGLDREHNLKDLDIFFMDALCYGAKCTSPERRKAREEREQWRAEAAAAAAAVVGDIRSGDSECDKFDHDFEKWEYKFFTDYVDTVTVRAEYGAQDIKCDGILDCIVFDGDSRIIREIKAPLKENILNTIYTDEVGEEAEWDYLLKHNRVELFIISETYEDDIIKNINFKEKFNEKSIKISIRIYKNNQRANYIKKCNEIFREHEFYFILAYLLIFHKKKEESKEYNHIKYLVCKDISGKTKMLFAVGSNRIISEFLCNIISAQKIKLLGGIFQVPICTKYDFRPVGPVAPVGPEAAEDGEGEEEALKWWESDSEDDSSASSSEEEEEEEAEDTAAKEYAPAIELSVARRSVGGGVPQSKPKIKNSYNFIIDPVTNKKHTTKSLKGRSIIQKFIYNN